MSVLLNKNTKVLVQGITGRIGNFHAEEMIAYGTNVVAGVTPGKGGTEHLGKPVFNTVKEAVDATGAEATIVFVPAVAAADGIMEAADAGIKYAVSITDGIPAHDMMRVKRYMLRYKKENKMVLTGPNCAGTITPVAPKVFKIVPAILLGTLIFFPLKSEGFTTLVSFMCTWYPGLECNPITLIPAISLSK